GIVYLGEMEVEMLHVIAQGFLELFEQRLVIRFPLQTEIPSRMDMRYVYHRDHHVELLREPYVLVQAPECASLAHGLGTEPYLDVLRLQLGYYLGEVPLRCRIRLLVRKLLVEPGMENCYVPSGEGRYPGRGDDVLPGIGDLDRVSAAQVDEIRRVG